MRRLIQYILKILAKITLKKYQPKVVGITGSNGKSSAKEAIACVLNKKFKVRASYRNFNNEVGVPLTILGVEPGGNSVFAWLKSLIKAIGVIIRDQDYPEILVLELAVDKPGDMKYLMSFISPFVGVITAIGEFPVHLEAFSQKEDLIREKGLLVQSFPEKGLAILNYDDPSVKGIGDKLKAEIVYCGFNQGADLKIDNYELHLTDLESKGEYGINFKLEHKGNVVPVRLNHVLGKHQAYAAAIGAAIGFHFGLNLVEIADALKSYRTLPGRTNLIRGIKNSWLIDDSYNASPLSTMAGLDILEDVAKHKEGGRKIAVLGSMAELGISSEEGHRQVGKHVAEVCDLLFAVGDKARIFLADEAKKQGMAKENILEFDTAQEAQTPVQNAIKQGDMVLIKGSHSMRMEKITKEVMAEPEKAGELLVN